MYIEHAADDEDDDSDATCVMPNLCLCSKERER